MERLYEFDDVLIEPIVSNVNSREDVSTSTRLPTISQNKFTLEVPIIASPMKGIVGTNLIVELGKLGGIGILHRFYLDQDEREKDLIKLQESGVPYGIAIGLDKREDWWLLERIYHRNFTPNIVCIDVANGYTKKLHEFCWYIYNMFRGVGIENLALMSGNVISNTGVRQLNTHGVSLARVGIGSGQLCTTRNVTGIGYPQLSALLRMRGNWTGLVADGGIKNTGDLVKALCAGADAVMMGSMFATVEESDNDGTVYGMASQELQDNFYGSHKSIEGISKEVEKKTTLKEMVDQISWAIKSAGTYLNSKTIKDMQFNAKFIEVGTHSIINK